MICFDNIIFFLQRSGGISRFWSNLIDDDLFNSIDNCFIEPVGYEINIYRNKLNLKKVIPDRNLPIWALRYMDFGSSYGLKEVAHCSVFHSSYYRICRDRGVANITTVHDLIYEKFSRGISRLAHIIQKKKALMRSDCIICVSENTKRDLLECYPQIVNKDIRVVPNGVDGFKDYRIKGTFHVKDRAYIHRSYFLYVGHRGELKGFQKVFKVLMSHLDLYLIVVGIPFTRDEISQIELHGCNNRVINIGLVSDVELNYLYSNAEFFFFPSYYEGFGIPPIEAMMSMCPVVASSRSSIPEVVGNAALIFDPDSDEQIDEMVNLARSDAVRNKLVRLGSERCHRFTWINVKDKYRNIYNEYC